MVASVLIVDDRHDVLELSRILLEAEGYTTEGYSYAEATPEQLRQSQPDVVLLDLVPGDEAPWELLRRLRDDPATRELGVVVTSDAPAPIERAMGDASLGVAAGLTMPFDIDALYASIAAAAQHRPELALAGMSVPLLQRAAEALREGRQPVLLRWVQRLSTLDVFRRNPDLSLAQLQGQGGALIDGVIDALDTQVATRGAIAVTVGVRVDAVREHVRLRRAQGVSRGDVAREMAALRREVWREVRGSVAQDTPSIDDVWGLLRRLTTALEESLAAMLDAWDDAVER